MTKKTSVPLPPVISISDIVSSDKFSRITMNSTIRLSEHGEFDMRLSDVYEQSRSEVQSIRPDSRWFGPSIVVAIQRAGLKYITHVKKFYQNIVNEFHTFTATDKWCKKCHQKQLPPARIGGFDIPVVMRSYILEIDANTIVYTIRSPGDKENKRSAAAVIRSILPKVIVIRENIDSKRVDDDMLKTVSSSKRIIGTYDGKRIIGKKLSGVICRLPDGNVVLDELTIPS